MLRITHTTHACAYPTCYLSLPLPKTVQALFHHLCSYDPSSTLSSPSSAPAREGCGLTWTDEICSWLNPLDEGFVSGACGFEVSIAVLDDIVPGAGALIGDVARVSIFSIYYFMRVLK